MKPICIGHLLRIISAINITIIPKQLYHFISSGYYPADKRCNSSPEHIITVTCNASIYSKKMLKSVTRCLASFLFPPPSSPLSVPLSDTQTTLAVPSPPDICSFSNNAQLQGCSAKCLLKGPKSDTWNAVILKRQTQVRIKKKWGGINKSSGERGR